MAKFNRCLVTGATGFVGSHLTRRLVQEGKEVHILVRKTSSLNAIADIEDKLTIHYLPAPRTSLTENVAAAVASAKPDVVFHLAAMFRADHTAADIAPMVEANILFTTLLLEGMLHANVKSIVNTGTSWQHYQDAPYDPVCLYAATKQAAEDIITYYCNAHGFKAVTLKLFDTYGPQDTRNKLFNIFKRASESSIPVAFSSGDQLIDLVHIDDVMRAYMTAASRAILSKGNANEKYGVSSFEPLPLRVLASEYENHTGKQLNITWGERSYRAREVMCPPNLLTLPNWAPKITLAEGLAKIVFRQPTLQVQE